MGSRDMYVPAAKGGRIVVEEHSEESYLPVGIRLRVGALSAYPVRIQGFYAFPPHFFSETIRKETGWDLKEKDRSWGTIVVASSVSFALTASGRSHSLRCSSSPNDIG